MRKLLTLALVAGLAPFAFADGNSAKASANATVTIYAPVTLSVSNSLDFGKVVITNTSSAVTVDLDANGGAKYGNSAALNFSASPQIPVFTGSKDASLGLSVATGSSSVTKGATLTVGKIADIAAGSTSFSVKPTYSLSVPAGVTGDVTGQVTITVAYL